MLTTLYTFCSQPNCSDGEYPNGPLTVDADGNLYGSTYGGGIQDGFCGQKGCGVVFGLHPLPRGQWKEELLYSFQSNNNNYDGAIPSGGLALHAGGLYGTTVTGGQHFVGTVYDLTRGSGNGLQEQILRSFGANGAQGSEPSGGVVFDAERDMFGVTSGGGSPDCGCGTVYGMKPQDDDKWGFAVLHSFDYSDGALPEYGLTVDSEGNLYGTTMSGGPGEGGVVFELSPVTQAPK